MRARYSYDPKKPPSQAIVKAAVLDFLTEALHDAKHMEKAGLQREDFKEERATMSFMQRTAAARKGGA
jgi:hypothetical protein